MIIIYMLLIIIVVFSYELDESYESEIGKKDIEPDIFNCTLNGQDVNISKNRN